MSDTAWCYVNLAANVVMVLFTAGLTFGTITGADLGAGWWFFAAFCALHIVCASYWLWAIQDDLGVASPINSEDGGEG